MDDDNDDDDGGSSSSSSSWAWRGMRANYGSLGTFCLKIYLALPGKG